MIPAAEVRRRGDRRRRRQQTLAVAGSAAALAAVVAIPLAVAGGGVLDRSDDVPPAEPEPTPAVVTTIPAGFPLSAGMGGGSGLSPEQGPLDPDAGHLSALQICGEEVWSAQQAEDSLAASWSESGQTEGGEHRTLVVYADEAAATQALATIDDSVAGCTESVDGRTETVPLEAPAAGADGTTFLTRFLNEEDGTLDGNGDLYTAVQEGNALLLQRVYVLGVGDPAQMERSQALVQGWLEEPVAAMCLFTAEGCATDPSAAWLEIPELDIRVPLTGEISDASYDMLDGNAHLTAAGFACPDGLAAIEPIGPDEEVAPVVAAGAVGLFTYSGSQDVCDPERVEEETAVREALLDALARVEQLPGAEGGEAAPTVLDEGHLVTAEDALPAIGRDGGPWRQVTTVDVPTLVCQGAWLNSLGAAERVTRELRSFAPGTETELGRINVAVLEFADQDAADTAYDTVRGWLDECPATHAGLSRRPYVDEPGHSVEVATGPDVAQVERAHQARVTHGAPEVGGGGNDAAWFAHETVAQVGTRLVLVSHAERAGPCPPMSEGVDDTCLGEQSALQPWFDRAQAATSTAVARAVWDLH
jgi:hypothetical protein